MGPWSIIGSDGHFNTIFAPKMMTLLSHLLRQNALGIQTKIDQLDKIMEKRRKSRKNVLFFNKG